MRKSILLLLLAAVVGIQALAIPAHKGFLPMPQPDGTMVSIGLVGDEFYHFNITEDGYTVILNEQSGAYVYAQQDGDRLVESTMLAHNAGERSADELALLAATPKRLMDRAAVDQAHILRAKRNVDLSNFDLANFHGLVILIDFADVKFRSEDPKAFYTDMFSTEGFTGFDEPVKGVHVNCLGSVRDYFKDQSNGAFNPPFDVYGPYTSTRNAVQCRNYSSSIFTTALKTANEEIDFSRYDNNNDGKVDMIYFLVAGYSSSYDGNNMGYLWPHASNLSYTYSSYDGKWLDRYACSTELYGFESSPTTVTVEGIGTICHEFSHVLGLPDFYDTDYSDGGGQSHDPGGWDVMAGGADYNYGRTPAGYTFYERYALGWAYPKTITETGSYSLEAVNKSREGYILRSPVKNEFFTIENRQRTSWDSYLPGHGMIVTRVDSTNANIWTNNKVNCNPAHNYFEILRAGNSTSGDNGSDPFPGSTGNPMLTNETNPSLKTWAGKKNAFNIVGIQEKEGIISFEVIEDGGLLKMVEDFEAMEPTTTTNEADVEGTLATWTFNKAGVRSPGDDLANGTNSVLMKAPSQFYSVTDVSVNSYLAQLTVFNSTSSVAKLALEYSIDQGAHWLKAMTPTGVVASEVPAKANGTCYWVLQLKSSTPARFRISQTGGNKNSPIYVDDFTLYYNEEVPVTLVGDVNKDNQVNISDVNAVINMILSGKTDSAGDVNNDGQINISDINLVIAKILNSN